MIRTIDLNCDLGESFGAWRMGQDEAVLDWVTSANIACGFHAGDPPTMARTVRAAVARGVALGAHPSWPDLQGFGRRFRPERPTTWCCTSWGPWPGSSGPPAAGCAT